VAGEGVEMVNLMCWVSGFIVGSIIAIVICKTREQNEVLGQLENGLRELEDAQAELQRQAVLRYGPKALHWIVLDAEQIVSDYEEQSE